MFYIESEQTRKMYRAKDFSRILNKLRGLIADNVRGRVIVKVSTDCGIDRKLYDGPIGKANAELAITWLHGAARR